MRVLVACECSGVVRNAFRELGHDAWSCDLQAADDGSEFHIQTDCRRVLRENWDLMIAHPPCTYLTLAETTEDLANATWVTWTTDITYTFLSAGAKTIYAQVKNETSESSVVSDTITVTVPSKIGRAHV